MSRKTRRSINTVIEESAENALDSTGGSGNVLDRENENPEARQTKRYRLFAELLETEHNYVNVLESIINNFKIPMDQLVDINIVGPRERKVLFSRFEPLLIVHQCILSSLKQLDKQWTEKALVGQVYATAKDALLENYVPYFNRYDFIKDTLNDIVKIQRVNEFIQDCESNSDGRRFKLTDLLIRPVQRLPSVMLLISGLIKETSKKNPDFPWLHEAYNTLNLVLSKSNEKRAEDDKRSDIMNVINQIDGFPDELVTYKRVYYDQAHFYILKANGMFSRYKNYKVTFFMFADCVTVAKRRSTSGQEGSTLFAGNSLSRISTLSRTNTFNRSAYGSTRTLQRNISLLSFVKQRERKPFSHLEALRFPAFRALMYFHREGIFFVKVRDERGEEINAFQIAGETTVESACYFFNTLCSLIKETSGRDIQLEQVSTKLMSEEIQEEDQIFMLKAKDAAVKLKDGSFRPPSTLQSAVRNVSARIHRSRSKSRLLNIGLQLE